MSASRGVSTRRISRKDQLDVLASPVRMAILDVFHAKGPSSIAQVARALDVSPNSLYYHVKKLVEVGLLVEDSVRKGKRRSETVYALRPAPFHLEMAYDPKVKGTADALGRCAASMLRMTERDAKAALERGDVVDYGRHRNYHVGRIKIRLTKRGLERLNHLIRQIEDLFRQEGPQRQGDSYGFTLALIPLAEKPPKRAQPDRRGKRKKDNGRVG